MLTLPPPIISQKQEKIMEYSILDFKVYQYAIPLMKILNHLLCLFLKENETAIYQRSLDICTSIL